MLIQGTMLFIGDYYDGTDSEIYVVDEQQRLTNHNYNFIFSNIYKFCPESDVNKIPKQLIKS